MRAVHAGPPVSEVTATLRAGVDTRRPARARALFPELLCLPLLAAAVALPPLLRGELIGRGEMPHEYSLYAFVGRALHRGYVPLWNPYTVSGNPGLADPASNVFYPLTAPLLLLGSVAGALNTMFVLHMVLAGLFMHVYLGSLRLSRPARFAGAMAYMLSGFVGWRILSGDIPRIATYAWLPLAFYLVEEIASGRRGMGAALLGGLVIAVECFAGEPQAFAHATLALAAYAGFRFAAIVLRRAPRAAVRRAGLLLAVMFVAGAGLAAPQLLPTLEDFRYSNRPGLDAGFATLGSIPPIGLVSVLAPRFFGDEIHGWWGERELSAREFYPHAASLYTGFFTLVLAIAAVLARRDRPHVRFFAGFGIAVLWIALGKFGYLYRLAAYVPILKSFRDVENINILVPLSASVLAAFGFDRFLEPDDPKAGGSNAIWNRVLEWTALAVASGVILVGMTLLYERYHGLELLSLPFVRKTAAESALFVAAAWAVSAALIRARRMHRAAPGWLIAAAIAFLSADLLYASAPLIAAGTPLRPLAEPDGITQFLAGDRSLYRVSGLFDRGPAFGVQDTDGEPSLLLARYQRYTDALQGRGPNGARPEGPHGVVIRAGLDSSLLALLNVKYSIVSAQDQPISHVRDPLRLVQVAPNDFIYRNPLVFPRAMAVGSYHVVRDPEALLRELDRAGFDPRTTALLEQEPALPPGFALAQSTAAAGPPGRVTVTSYGDNEIVAEADFARAGFLVLNDVYYPAWQAIIDGRPAAVYRANYLFRAVAVVPGRHTVRFVYRDRTAIIGGTIALLTMLWGVAALVLDRGRRG
ncbi:MAG TPA: hypothetical protein VKW09_04290 [bacterium]|nr:hypothetical protein [bacterium]